MQGDTAEAVVFGYIGKKVLAIVLTYRLDCPRYAALYQLPGGIWLSDNFVVGGADAFKTVVAPGVVSISVMGSGFIASVYNLSYLTLAVTGTAVHFEGVQFPALNHVPDGGLAHAELFCRLFLGERFVFLRFHKNGEKTLACGFDCVHHQLMEV